MSPENDVGPEQGEFSILFDQAPVVPKKKTREKEDGVRQQSGKGRRHTTGHAGGKATVGHTIRDE